MVSSNRLDVNASPHLAHNTQKWVHRLADFSFSIEYTPGERKALKNMLTQMITTNNDTSSVKCSCILTVTLIEQEMLMLFLVTFICES